MKISHNKEAPYNKDKKKYVDNAGNFCDEVWDIDAGLDSHIVSQFLVTHFKKSIRQSHYDSKTGQLAITYAKR